MGDKQMSQHQASVIVGQRMANRYIETDGQQTQPQPQTYEF